MLEAYQAYADYNVMAAAGPRVDSGGRVRGRRITRGDALRRHRVGSRRRVGSVTLFGVALRGARRRSHCRRPIIAQLQRYAEKHDLSVDPKWGAGQAGRGALRGPGACPALQAPTFVRDYPGGDRAADPGPPETPGLTEKWDLYVLGFELGTAYSELVDPVVQRERLVAQALLAAGGDAEAMRAGRGFPAGHGVRNAAGRRHGNGNRPAADGAHRSGHSGNDPLPVGPARVVVVRVLADDRRTRH